jgi:hypothetical protein
MCFERYPSRVALPIGLTIMRSLGNLGSVLIYLPFKLFWQLIYIPSVVLSPWESVIFVVARVMQANVTRGWHDCRILGRFSDVPLTSFPRVYTEREGLEDIEAWNCEDRIRFEVVRLRVFIVYAMRETCGSLSSVQLTMRLCWQTYGKKSRR